MTFVEKQTGKQRSSGFDQPGNQVSSYLDLSVLSTSFCSQSPLSPPEWVLLLLVASRLRWVSFPVLIVKIYSNLMKYIYQATIVGIGSSSKFSYQLFFFIYLIELPLVRQKELVPFTPTRSMCMMMMEFYPLMLAIQMLKESLLMLKMITFPFLNQASTYDKNDIKIALTPQMSAAARPGVVMILARFQVSGSELVVSPLLASVSKQLYQR